MKKTLILFLSAMLVLSAVSCKKDSNESSETSESAVSSEVEKTDRSSETKESEKEVAESSQAETEAEQSESTGNTETTEKTVSSADGGSQESGSSESGMDEKTAYELYQSAMEMYGKVLLSCPYRLDYDSMDANGFVLISDTSVTSVEDIASLYCTVFTEPARNIYERYVEHDGRVYCNDTSRGTNIYYTGTDLEYVSGDENCMIFNAVSHYSNPETGEAMADKTAVFSVILTEDGYRVDEFDYPQ